MIGMMRRRDFLRLGAVALVPACSEVAVPRAGLPFEIPRITSNDAFYVVQYDSIPSIDGSAWRLNIDGLASRSASLSLDGIMNLPLRDKEHTLQCIGASPRNQAISNAIWTGIPLTELFASFEIEIDEAARYMHLFSADGFINQLETSDLSDREVWLVTGMNGETLPAAHGFPARLLVSNRYGFKNPKWITAIEVTNKYPGGYWEDRGFNWHSGI